MGMPRTPSGSLPGPRQMHSQVRQASREKHPAERRPGKVPAIQAASTEDEQRLQHLQRTMEDNSRRLDMQKQENKFLRERMDALLKERKQQPQLENSAGRRRAQGFRQQIG